MGRNALVFAVPVALAALSATFCRRVLLNWGATPAERTRALPGDEVLPDASDAGTMAVTLDAPPEDVWPWLAQMGCDRAGFYSWDRLDNGGRPSAETLHPEWQDIRAGSRVMSRSDETAWFTVVRCDEPHVLVLRASLSLRGKPFDPAGRPPRHFSDSTWAFHLERLPGDRTRMLVRARGRGEPAGLVGLSGVVFWHPAHWVMQTKQFRELRRRVAPRPVVTPMAPENAALSLVPNGTDR